MPRPEIVMDPSPGARTTIRAPRVVLPLPGHRGWERAALIGRAAGIQVSESEKFS